jgi:ribosomal protein S18 acetylase RimI-like enzyme
MNRHAYFHRPRRILPALDFREPPPAPVVELRHYGGERDYLACADISRFTRGRYPDLGPDPIARHGRRGVPTIGLVGVMAGEVAGYLLYQPSPGGLEIVDLCVHPDARRKTAGTHLLRWLRGRLGPGCRSARDHIRAFVPEGALDLQLFLQAQGYSAVAHDRGRCVDDAGRICMWFDLASRVADDTGCVGDEEGGRS